MKFREFKHEPVKPDTYEASMALNQLMRIGKHAIKLHNMIDDNAEMESWVASKIDLAGDYVKKVYNYTEAEKAGYYEAHGGKHTTSGRSMTKGEMDKREKIVKGMKKDKAGFKKRYGKDAEAVMYATATKQAMGELKKMPKGTGTMYGVKEDAGDMDLIGDGAENLGLDANKFDYYYDTSGAGYGEVRTKSGKAILQFEYDRDGDAEVSTMDNKTIANIKQGEQLPNNVTAKLNMIKEDAGDQEKMQGLLQWFKNKYDTYRKDFIDDQIENGIRGSQLEQAVENNDELVELENIIDALKSGSMKDAIEEINRAKYEFSGIPGDGDDFMQVIEKLGIPKDTFYFTKDESLEARLEAKLSEDAGEGHMSKSTLYHTAKYAIELMQMIKKGDDLEGWVQSKLNKAADYLQGVYNYEEYQKLNPYREELDSSLMQKHAQVIQKNIDEILAKETKLDDIDTKPGMMRILAKRVNEVEKEIAKETRKQNEGRMSDIDADMKTMSDEDFKKKYGKSKEQMEKDLNESGIMYRAGVKKYGKKGMTAIQSAAGKGASHQEIGKIKDKYLKDEELDEGLKDWAKSLAMAGIIVAGMAGVGSIQNAIDNSVPAVKAMNTAYEMAMDAGNTELADMIKNDISAVKVRLDSGRDLNFVKSMQDKYSKFMQTEGLAYESKLAVLLNQRLK